MKTAIRADILETLSTKAQIILDDILKGRKTMNTTSTNGVLSGLIRRGYIERVQGADGQKKYIISEDIIETVEAKLVTRQSVSIRDENAVEGYKTVRGNSVVDESVVEAFSKVVNFADEIRVPVKTKVKYVSTLILPLYRNRVAVQVEMNSKRARVITRDMNFAVRLMNIGFTVKLSKDGKLQYCDVAPEQSFLLNTAMFLAMEVA